MQVENSNLKSKISESIINTNNVVKKWKDTNKISKFDKSLDFKENVISVLKHELQKNLKINHSRFRQLSKILKIKLDDNLLIDKILLVPFYSHLYDETKEIKYHIESLNELEYSYFKFKDKELIEYNSSYFNENFNFNLESIESIKF